MKANIDVIMDFINGRESSNRNLRTDGNRLVNYNTCIASKCEDGTIIYNRTKYSTSTSKIQSYLRDALKGRHYVVTIKTVPRGASYLSPFI